MSAHDNQWPVGTAPVVLKAAIECKRSHSELLAMLRRTTLGLQAIAMLNADIGPNARAAATGLANEAAALIKRVEGK